MKKSTLISEHSKNGQKKKKKRKPLGATQILLLRTVEKCPADEKCARTILKKFFRQLGIEGDIVKGFLEIERLTDEGLLSVETKIPKLNSTVPPIRYFEVTELGRLLLAEKNL